VHDINSDNIWCTVWHFFGCFQLFSVITTGGLGTPVVLFYCDVCPAAKFRPSCIINLIRHLSSTGVYSYIHLWKRDAEGVNGEQGGVSPLPQPTRES